MFWSRKFLSPILIEYLNSKLKLGAEVEGNLIEVFILVNSINV
jgi:hypothetical protein